MSRDRILAVLLLLVALAALAAGNAFPFVEDAPWALKSAVAVVGAACLLLGVRLWVRGSGQDRNPTD
ncbi:hypothetical protein AB0J86_27430 [Micromonospora sp. NPDC049559]|uniref:hypothetical protein n=1 Tax=Micromonospora sp. NPDC049559 TaxID=3155923 RepID=UPI003448F8EB